MEFFSPPRTLRSCWVYILGPKTGSQRKLWLMPRKVQKPGSSLGGTAQSSPLPQSSSRIYTEAQPKDVCSSNTPVSATTSGFHFDPPVGTVIHKTITVIKLAMWGKKEKTPSPLESPPKPQDIHRDTYFPMKTRRNVDSSHPDPCLLRCRIWCLILERPADPSRESHACST